MKSVELSSADPFCASSEPRVSVVMPTINEALNLPAVLARMPDVYELIVVDGGSIDGTVSEVLRLRPDARIITQPGRGKGDALGAGFLAASGEIVVMLDPDGSTDPAEIPIFIDALRAGADVAKGSRFVPGGGSSDITIIRRLGNWMLSRLVNSLYGTNYTDLCYGYNAFRAHRLPELDIACEGLRSKR